MPAAYRHLLKLALVFVSVCGLSGCLGHGKPAEPMPTHWIPSPVGEPEALVIVLPGRADDVAGLYEAGIAQAIQRGWPEADVLLTGATLPYYLAGDLPQRLHDRLIAPLRSRYRQIWLLGASMGGLGTLLYEHGYPDQLDGLVLMAPYMGERKLIREVRDAGGPARWQPGPQAVSLQEGEPRREAWRVVKRWSERPARAQQVWLAVGRDDPFLEVADMIAPLLPADHYLALDGGHRWTVWNAAATEIFAAERQRYRQHEPHSD